MGSLAQRCRGPTKIRSIYFAGTQHFLMQLTGSSRHLKILKTSHVPAFYARSSYQAEYEAFCQKREQAQLPYVTYRNFLRRWPRSAKAHGEDIPSDKGLSKGTAGQREREGGKGSGGVTPPPPPPPSRKRQTGNEDGGVAPPTVKAKSGDSPSTGVSVSSRQARYEAARTSLQAMGYTGFPHQDPGCAGSFQDLNEHRVSVVVTQALQSGLAVVEAATTATAHALMQTFLCSRRGPNDEDLMELLSFPTEQGAG